MVDYFILFVLVNIAKSLLSFRRLFIKDMGFHVHFSTKQCFCGRGTYMLFVWANISRSMGDGHMVEACGKGDIQFTMTFEKDRSKRVTMQNALYVPKLTCSLFSVRATVMKGNTVKFENGSCLIYDRNGILLGTGSLVDKFYYLKCKSVTQESIAIATGSKVENKVDLWHQRLGHLNEVQLKEMVSEDLVKGVNIPKSTRISFCEKCVEGKMSKNHLNQWEKFDQ